MVVLKVFQFCGCILAVVGFGAFLYSPFLIVTQVVFDMFFLQFLRFGGVGEGVDFPSRNSFPVLCVGCLTK